MKIKLATPLLILLWLITRLPISIQFKIGRALGWLTLHTAKNLKKTTETNLRLCFPHWTDEEREKLLKENFSSLGMGIIEAGMAWYLSDTKFKHCNIELYGMEHADEAFKKGSGIILLGPHFTSLELIGRIFGNKYSFATLYRPHKRKTIANLLLRLRKRYNIQQIPRHDMRGLIKTLQSNTAVWYAYDIDAGKKRSVFAPFFGIQTASLTSVSRIVELTQATILPLSFYRTENPWGYVIKIGAPIKSFPTGDFVTDATRLNKTLEEAILEKPSQYIWQYKRFKTRPEHQARFY